MTSAPRNDEQGVILIALMWILVALSVIALSFSRESRVDVSVARNTRDLTVAYYVARAGIQTAVFRLLERVYAPPVQGIETQEPSPLDLGELQGDFGGGAYRVEIQDEAGKINLNFVTEDQLRALFAAIGIPKENADVITDSIMDWRDVDKAHRINGAEDDYYEQLPHPYKAKNGRIETVEELLLVRGVTSEYYYGQWEKGQDGSRRYLYGLSRCFTVYSNSNRININYAPPEVLMSVPGMTPQIAQMIYERRKVKPFRTPADLTRDLSITLGPQTLPFLSTDRSMIYTLTAYAHMENSKVKRVIRAVVSLDPSQINRYKIVYWNENISDL